MTLLPLVPPDEMPAPRGVYPIPLELEDGEQEALLWTDDAGTPANVLKVNLVDDEILIGSSDRPIALKVYDPTSGTDAVVALGSGIAAPRGLQATTPVGTIEGLWQCEGDRNDDSGNGYHLTLAGPSGGVARYAHLHCGGGSKEGAVFLGDTWWTIATSSAPNLNISGALTLEMLLAPLSLTQNANTDVHLSQFAYLMSLADSTFASPFSNARYAINGGVLSASAAQIGYAHETAAPALAYTTDPAPLLPGQLMHYCVTRDSAGTGINLYINGYLRHSGTLGAAPGGTAGDTFTIGTINGGAGNLTFRGWLGGAAVIAGELNATQVLARANYALGLPY